MRSTGAGALVEGLKREGVEVIFGYPGGASLPIYDALFDSGIRHILARHEQAAAFAADGYARVTGKVGVALATSGPGATNLVTGIANAFMDSTPLVAITGQVARPLLGKDSFQEVDITGITTPITKHNFLVKRAEDLPRVVAEAFYIARTGRPGPVLIDLPKDVAATEFESIYPEKVEMRSYRPEREGDPAAVDQAAELIVQAKRPLLLVGGGVVASGATPFLRDLMHRAGIPAVASLMGLGAIPADDPLFLGMFGMHGTYAANLAVHESDLLIGCGIRFDDRQTGDLAGFAPHARVIHLDVDPAEINKNVKAYLPVVADLSWSLAALLEGLDAHPDSGGLNPRLAGWRQAVWGYRQQRPLRYENGGAAIKPQYVIEELSRLTGGQAVVTTDVGQHQMWTAQFYRFQRPRQFITSGGLGSMGFGLPAAIGAQVGCPDRTVVTVSGDGSFLMNCQEVITAVENELPIVVAILNNGYLGMVRQWQELFYRRRYSSSTLDHAADLAGMVEAMGAVGLRATRPSEVGPVLEQALGTRRPVFIDFRVSPEENVYPMVPGGANLNQMIGG